MKFLKVKIRHAQNVGKVQISRKKQLLTRFGAISGKFFHGPEKCQKHICLLFFLGGPMDPIQPVWWNGCNISPATCM